MFRLLVGGWRIYPNREIPRFSRRLLLSGGPGGCPGRCPAVVPAIVPGCPAAAGDNKCGVPRLSRVKSVLISVNQCQSVSIILNPCESLLIIVMIMAFSHC